ncbi:hypothetical protein BCY84_05822 [Trypanosoma cruzi cruzi]|uniref:Uncharacterized protein n=1 Tax=Trypanosoma cruzi TaxID=5693 RepID=A0A2V2VQ14_TRYCR|nr:hypothetical protein TcBrA4_0091180 [Trypanosoma cruzi]PBJ77753.1 hypothetical protein BCY84_05822 [Trypanosoma cruzi cruzi]PWU98400.1 hypothetical protein C4B63_12g318 [Trypanosoma cruzi]
MWLENITKDLGDFTSSLMEDTKGLADMVSRIAAEVTGHSIYIAGDEDSLLAQECPLDEAAIFALQRTDAVYLEEPREPEEKALFEEWIRRSVYSSVNAFCRDQFDGSGSGSSYNAAMTCRQRLLDENPLVAEKYAAMVQTSDLPQRESPSESKTTPGQPSLEGREGDVKTPTKSATASPSDSQRITEDAFFDRYFFRLSQLRLSTAAERRKREEDEAAAVAAAAAAAAKVASEAEALRKGQSKGKSLAERFMEATDELVGWKEEEPADAKDTGDGEDRNSRGVVHRTEAEWREQEGKIAALESLVHLLQVELNDERRKLAAVLKLVQQCNLSESQMQWVHAAMKTTTTAANSSAASLSSSPPTHVENTAMCGSGAHHGDGACESGRDAAVQETSSPEAVHQQQQQQCEEEAPRNPASPPSSSSSLDNDGWTNV